MTTETASESVQKNNDLELVFVLDRSGSMGGRESDTIGGFNSVIKKNSDGNGGVKVTTVLFDDRVETLHDRIEIASMKPMTEKEYYVRGCTALLDAVGSTIERIRTVHSVMKEGTAPGRTMFVIITDGLENSSREFTYDRVKELIEKQKECGWEFVFMGANIDAAKEASRMGISSDRAIEYLCDREGLEICYDSIGDAVCDMRYNSCMSKKSFSKVRADTKKRKH